LGLVDISIAISWWSDCQKFRCLATFVLLGFCSLS
jgi:hypothetical protein